MATVVGVRFRRNGRLYYFDPVGIGFEVDDYAVVETSNHLDLARVVLTETELAEEELGTELKEVVRKGTAEDMGELERNGRRAERALHRFQEVVSERGLPIVPLQAEYSLDGANLAFQISAEERIDYRALAREMAEEFGTRIELRQVRPRDRARIVDGLGQCGLSLCCSTWLEEPGNVSVRMAKDQNLPLNPAKISGACGRLLCCLRYEHDMYLQGQIPEPKAKVPEEEPVGFFAPPEQAEVGFLAGLPAARADVDAGDEAGGETATKGTPEKKSRRSRRGGRRRSRRRRRGRK
jgi:cell fate regulator YaaT (PSP1 superfamily)